MESRDLYTFLCGAANFATILKHAPGDRIHHIFTKKVNSVYLHHIILSSCTSFDNPTIDHLYITLVEQNVHLSIQNMIHHNFFSRPFSKAERPAIFSKPESGITIHTTQTSADHLSKHGAVGRIQHLLWELEDSVFEVFAHQKV